MAFGKHKSKVKESSGVISCAEMRKELSQKAQKKTRKLPMDRMSIEFDQTYCISTTKELKCCAKILKLL